MKRPSILCSGIETLYIMLYLTLRARVRFRGVLLFVDNISISLAVQFFRLQDILYLGIYSDCHNSTVLAVFCRVG